MIEFILKPGTPFPKGQAMERRGRKLVAQMMETTGTCNSASGWTALQAIEWCRENAKPFRVSVTMYGGHEHYFIEVLKTG